MNSFIRTFQRYAVPKWLSALVLFFRDGVTISPSSRVQLSGQIRFGRKSVVKPNSIIQTSGGSITFGHNCAISSFNHIAAGPSGNISCGNFVRTGPGVKIIATTRNYASRDRPIVEQGYSDRGITIGNDVLIGSNSVLVDGCEVGDGAIVGVGSVVTGKVPPYAIVFGVPAKVIMWRQ